jgi:hypothetical protein
MAAFEGRSSSKAGRLDMTGAQISHFHVLVAERPLEIILGGTQFVWLEGEIDLLKVSLAACAEMPSITLVQPRPGPSAGSQHCRPSLSSPGW